MGTYMHHDKIGYVNLLLVFCGASCVAHDPFPAHKKLSDIRGKYVKIGLNIQDTDE